MTKEEILRKTFGIIPFVHIMDSYESICHSMEEYAKQQAIDYCSWYCSVGYLPKVRNMDDYKPGESFMKSHEELYDEFTESKSK